MNDFEEALPHDVPAEQATLGAALLSSQALAVAMERLTADDFHDPRHQAIFEMICDRYDRGLPVEARLVIGDVIDTGRVREIGGDPTYVINLVHDAPVPAQAPHFAARVGELAVLRRLDGLGVLARRAVRSVTEGGTRNSGDIIALIQAELDRVAGATPTGDMTGWTDLYAEGMDAIAAAGANGGALLGLPTGLVDLDKLTNGLRPGQLWIVAARPGAGKSVFAMNLVRAAALRHGTGVALFSLEMSRTEVFMRLASAESGVPQSLLETGELVEEQEKRLATRLAVDAPIWVNDRTAITTAAIRAQSRRLKQRHNIGLVVVDYLQLIGTPKGSESRQAAVSEMSRALKTLASELEIPVVALSQLNRQSEQRHDKRPQLSDLRESGSLEQDANVVLLLHREDYYEAKKRPGEIDVIVAKNRGGKLGTVTAAAQFDRARIVGFSLDDPTPAMA